MHMHAYVCGVWCSLLNFDGLKSLYRIQMQESHSLRLIQKIWYLDIYFEKIPQVTLLCFLVGDLCHCLQEALVFPFV